MTPSTSRSLRLIPRLREERGNCFLYGCVTLVLLGLLGGLVAFLVLRYQIQQIREEYTAAEPVELPTAELPEDRTDALIARADRFAEALRNDEPTEPLTLTEAETNALLQRHPELRNFYGESFYVVFNDNNTVTAQTSVSLDWLPGFAGRYFNGEITTDVSVEDGRLEIFLQEAVVKGEPVPDQLMAEFRRRNLAQDIDRDTQALVDKIQSLTIEAGALTIVPVLVQESAEPDATEPETAEPSTPAN